MTHMDKAFLTDFTETVDDAANRLLAMADEKSARKPAPGKWSPKEIIGHLIDSAANNHSRFVRAQAGNDLVFEGYDQDAWVRVQRYQERSWPDLVRLWRMYNHHLAAVMASADPAALVRPRTRHNLDQIAWQPVEPDQPATLEYFMRDYAAHMKHHLRQILG
jgi:DinB family protein